MPTLHEKVTYAIMNAFFSRPIEEQYFNASPSDNEDLGRAAINAMCDEIARLQKQVEHFHQAMVKEAEARYAAETEIGRLRHELAKANAALKYEGIVLPRPCHGSD